MKTSRYTDSDLRPNFPPVISRDFGQLALRPNAGPPEIRVFRLLSR